MPDTATPTKKRAAKKISAPTKGASKNEVDDDDDDIIDDLDDDDLNDVELVAEDDDSEKSDNQDDDDAPVKGAVLDPEPEKTEEERREEIAKAQAELEKLEPSVEPLQWQIGQPPQMGGSAKNFSVYVQDKLPWMPRQQFFALVAKTLSNAIKEAGSDPSQMAELFGGEGTIIERGRRLRERDFTDAASFLTLAMELVAYSPTFFADCYVIWLDVPRDERRWARARFLEPWKPEQGKYGLKDEDHDKLIETFIDQNYEEIRRFFVVKLPRIGRRVALHERSQDRESKSDQ